MAILALASLPWLSLLLLSLPWPYSPRPSTPPAALQGWPGLDPPANARLLEDGTDEVSVGLREAFVARPGCVLVSADYSQIEMRLMAHFSRDAPLIAALQAGQDIFTAMAARLFGVAAPAEVKDAQRAQAKAVSYAILYGAGPGLLVQNLAVSIDDARRLIAAWHRAYPRVQELIEELY